MSIIFTGKNQKGREEKVPRSKLPDVWWYFRSWFSKSLDYWKGGRYRHVDFLAIWHGFWFMPVSRILNIKVFSTKPHNLLYFQNCIWLSYNWKKVKTAFVKWL